MHSIELTNDEYRSLKQAQYWRISDAETLSVDCWLCPRLCKINKGSVGFCKVRKNIDGTLFSLAYGYPVAIHVDPIEKKPLLNFLPNSRTFSLGTYGCNFDCKFCQNYTISKLVPVEYPQGSRYYSAREIVEDAIKSGCESISFTYNEPTIWIEYALDIAAEAKHYNLPLILVSNGFISDEPRKDLYNLIDAANIDMKGFSDEFYNSLCNGSLKIVLNSIKYLFDTGKHVEITNLIVPTKNDRIEMIKLFLDWVESNLSKDVPIHFSAFYPCYKLLKLERTSQEALYNIREYAISRGFTQIYIPRYIS